MRRRPIRVIADDLTGAADAGAALLTAGLGVMLSLRVGGSHWEDPRLAVVAADTATREATPAAAAAAAAAAARGTPAGAEVFKKVDSALRGHIGVELAALRDVFPRRVTILAPAFPGNGRVTRAGVQHVHGAPLHHGDHWALEAVDAPESIAGLLAPVTSSPVGLDLVRGASGRLPRGLVEAGRGGRVVICDAETDDDLDRIVGAAATCPFEVVWVGSAGLASALGRARRPGPGSSPGRRLQRLGPYLAVVGSAAPAAGRQASALAAEGGAELLELPVASLAAGDPGTLAGLGEGVLEAVERGDTVVRVTGPVDAGSAAAIVASLARVTAPAAAAASALLLTGGATARAVLDARGAVSLQLVAELDPGIVLAQFADRIPVPVVTKSGAFGDDRTLLRALQQITPEEGPTNCGN